MSTKKVNSPTFHSLWTAVDNPVDNVEKLDLQANRKWNPMAAVNMALHIPCQRKDYGRRPLAGVSKKEGQFWQKVRVAFPPLYDKIILVLKNIFIGGEGHGARGNGPAVRDVFRGRGVLSLRDRSDHPGGDGDLGGVQPGLCAHLCVSGLLSGGVHLLRELLQIPATFVFSVCIDLWMSLLGWLTPEHYGTCWVVLLLGCLALGCGVALEVAPNVLILPCEGFVRTASQVFGWDFGKTKTGYDLAMISAAALVSCLSLGAVYGLREGTVVCALTVGAISRFFCKRINLWAERLGGLKKERAVSHAKGSAV